MIDEKKYKKNKLLGHDIKALDEKASIVDMTDYQEIKLREAIDIAREKWQLCRYLSLYKKPSEL
jgi:hypothetical protein